MDMCVTGYIARYNDSRRKFGAPALPLAPWMLAFPHDMRAYVCASAHGGGGADERVSRRQVGLGLELAPLRRRRSAARGGPAEGGGLPGRAGEGVRRRVQVRPGMPFLIALRSKAQGVAAGGWVTATAGMSPVRHRRRSRRRSTARRICWCWMWSRSSRTGPQAAEELVPAHPRGAGATRPAVLQQLRHRPLPPLFPVRGVPPRIAQAPCHRCTGTPSARRSHNRLAGCTRTMRRWEYRR